MKKNPDLNDLAGQVVSVIRSEVSGNEKVIFIGHTFGNRVARTPTAKIPERVPKAMTERRFYIFNDPEPCSTTTGCRADMPVEYDTCPADPGVIS